MTRAVCNTPHCMFGFILSFYGTPSVFCSDTEPFAICYSSHYVMEKGERLRFVNALFRANKALN